MKDTPLSKRKHVTIFGPANAGKSTLFNRLLGQDISIVSSQEGTTTDPVIKAMELIPYGPIALIDTAGLGDSTPLGQKRMEKSRQMLERTDLALYVTDSPSMDEEFLSLLKEKSIPVLFVFTKTEYLAQDKLASTYPDAVFLEENTSLDALRQKIAKVLSGQETEVESMLSGLLPEGGTVVLVVPIDSAAPKGRLILPQVQLLRDCLDHGFTAVCTLPENLTKTLEKLSSVDLVVTDSQVFAQVDALLPKEIPLTSFSMLLARQKGDIASFIQGAQAVEKLKENAQILIAEGCTHNKTHEDIGTVKIPALLKKKTGKNFSFRFYAGNDFPESLSRIDMVIHCGGCMLTRRTVLSRQEKCRAQNVPMTNYGVILAYCSGILDRCLPLFSEEIYEK